jgi:hypothetical protein
VPERLLLFCLASDTDWQAASITHATAQQMMVRGLIERQASSPFAQTDQGRAVLAAMLERRRRQGLPSGEDRKTYARSEPYRS